MKTYRKGINNLVNRLQEYKCWQIRVWRTETQFEFIISEIKGYTKIGHYYPILTVLTFGDREEKSFWELFKSF